MGSVFRIGSIVLLTFLVVLLLWLRFTFGGGRPYEDLSTTPLLGPDDLEIAVVSDRPIGNAAVDRWGRVFYTIHPEARPAYPKLYRAVDGTSLPFPASGQESLFAGPLGVVVDRQDRLWVIDPAEHGTGQTKLLALDVETGNTVHEFEVPRDIAPLGSFLQDLQVDSRGETVYIADVGFWARRPALVVYDVGSGTARRVLDRHPSVMPQNWLVRTPIKDMTFFGGLVSLKPGVDGLALSRDDEWLYYGAMTHDTMFRVSTADLRDSSLSDDELAARIEAVGRKPLNDGLSTDDQENLYITDVEHQGIAVMRADGSLETLVRDARIRWADGLSFGPDGWLYLADSAIPHLALESRNHIAAQAPYYIWRLRPGGTGHPGQ